MTPFASERNKVMASADVKGANTKLQQMISIPLRSGGKVLT
jgi:hypothetical protein